MVDDAHPKLNRPINPLTLTGALAEDPKLLLLDELTTFLDKEDQFGVLQAVRSITKANNDVTAIWVTHRWGCTYQGTCTAAAIKHMRSMPDSSKYAHAVCSEKAMSYYVITIHHC